MKRPLLWPLSGFIAGILSLPEISLSPGLFFFLLTLALLGLCFSLFRRLKLGVLISIALGFALLGHTLAGVRLDSIEQKKLLAPQGDGAAYLIGRVEGACEEGEEGASFVMEAKALRFSEEASARPARGKVLGRIKEGGCVGEVGGVGAGLGEIKNPRRFQNRSSFDYPFFLKTRGITAT